MEKVQKLTYKELIHERINFEKKLEKYWYWVVNLIDDVCIDPKFWFELTLLTRWKDWYLQEIFQKNWYDLKKLERLALDFVKNFIS